MIPMSRTISIILGSAAFIFVVTYLVWITGEPLWSWVYPWIGTYSGELVMIMFLALICAFSGAIFSFFTGVQTRYFVTGGLLSYLVWWFYLEATAGPFDSPVHIILGIFLLTGFGVGAGLVEGAERRDILHRHNKLT